MRKRLVSIVLIFAVIAVLLLISHVLVPVVLKSKQHALLSGHIMLITMTKRETGNLITFPVDYLREGNTVYAGSDSTWWKNLEGGAEVYLLIQGTEYVGWATPITDNLDRIKEGFKKLRPWTYWRASWSGAVLVEIQLRDRSN
jgi:hypothetical protein